MYVLGISAFFHDSAAAIVRDGEIVAAAQEERFTRVKHERRYPRSAVEYCLAEAGVGLADVDRVVYYESPRRKRSRQLRTMVAEAPRGYRQARQVMRSWADRSNRAEQQLRRGLAALAPSVDWGTRLEFADHHLSHAAAAFYPSPFERAAILTVDAVGEHATTSTAVGDGMTIEPLHELRFPDSLGMLYSAFTQYLGFSVNSGEYKVMGLAPYGEPTQTQAILDSLIDVKADGSFRLSMEAFEFTRALTMTGERFATLFGGPPRRPDDPLEQRHMDVAASVQAVTDLVLTRLARSLREATGERALCMAGGVALNCVANRAILRSGCFHEIWVQPAAGDAGSAVGAALLGYHGAGGGRPTPAGDAMKGSLLGPSFPQADVERRLRRCGADFTVRPANDVIDETAAALADGQVVGWFHGRMEFGPRALGSRSILADPRRVGMQRDLNMKIKFREGFRPFAPAVLAEHAADWFDLDGPSPYMLFTADVADARLVELSDEDRSRRGFDRLDVARSTIPAVTHVDGSARVQTVGAQHDPTFHALISRFHELTGCPVVVNTSFNVRGEPIVCTPEDAFACFMGTDIDLLVVERCMARKADQAEELLTDRRRAFAPD